MRHGHWQRNQYCTREAWCCRDCKSADDAEETVQNILVLGGEALMVRCDVSKDDDVQAMVNQIVDRYGCVQVDYDAFKDKGTIFNPAKGSHESHDHS